MQNIAKFIGALALMLAAMSANAQRSTQVTVPFEFAAAARILPPGDYRVSFNASSELVTLRGAGFEFHNLDDRTWRSLQGRA